MLVHGPEEERLRLVSAIGPETSVFEVKERDTVTLPAGITVRVKEFMPRAVLETRPLVVPREQRERDLMEMLSLALVSAPGTDARWIPLADGREVEVLFSRQRLPLGTEVALEEFVLTAHAGGYTGETGSIRDYKSRLRFRDAGSAAWSDTVDTSMNSPAEHNGLWYFQAQWDAPDNRPSEGGIASAGLNYTVLGVANREGVYIQLLGCAVAVLGMIYAFYVKPVLKRRNREAVLASLAKDERKMQEVDA